MGGAVMQTNRKTNLAVVPRLVLGRFPAGLPFSPVVFLGLFSITAFIGIVIGFPTTATADSIECKEWAAKIVSIDGHVESLRVGETNWQSVKLDDIFCPEDKVRTLENSRAAILLQNETVLRLDENTMVKFSALKPESSSLLELLTGSAFFMSRYPRSLTIETPYVNAASGGTEFNIKVNPDDKSTTITVIEGQMNLSNEAGSAVVKAGEEAVTIAGQPPVVRIPVRPRDAIQWAVYYPPILSLRDLHLEAAEGLPDTDWRSMVQKSITAYNEGDIATAFSALESAPAQVDDPRFYVYRASLRLSVGRVDEANSDIDQALKLAPGNGLAFALQSIIAVVRNEKEAALKLAMAAAEAEANSVSVKIALSYAEQANFKLDEALATVQQAVKIDPNASLAWARLAELWMAHGYLDKALEAANKAAALNPREVRIQTVLGFAYLTEIKVAQAKEAFMKAIALNSAGPMPRLGLGLAMIREGDLEEGRKDIEIAASLDPNNALIRSYLGKAYYEEKRDPQAEIQFQQAKELDPKDPTPYFYDAIRKQMVNRPIEALHDLEKSVELNDNRAVYRSQLLLDSDQSARSVSVARVYGDLGFQQLALVEGWKSINLDPTNYSAHRLLADSYSALPLSQISQVSELLQAQLLQPLNSNPIQPRLGESEPAILAGAGPVEPSFNEFNQLFIRNHNQLLVSGIVGNQSTFGDEVILSGLEGRYSYSLGQFHYDTDGFRTNDDVRQNIYDAFAQVSLTPKLNIQGEARYDTPDYGDLTLNFDPENFSPTLDIEKRNINYRLGLHYTVAPGSDLLASFYYADNGHGQQDSTLAGFPPGSSFRNTIYDNGFNGEAQYLYMANRFNLIAGAGRFNGRDTEHGSFDIGFPPCNPCPFKNKTKTHNTNFYLYSYLKLPNNTTFTLGGSGDFFKGSPEDKNRWNPKAGLTTNVTSSTTLRIAVLRVLKRPLIQNQTLEPTQVAGLQQFFDVADGSSTWRRGIALDQKFYANLFGGLEYSYNPEEVPIVSVSTGEPTTVTEHDQLGLAYLYWTPLTWLAANAAYQFEKSDSDVSHDINYTPLGLKVTTNRVPLGLDLFNSTGLFAKFKGTYVAQRGLFERISTFSLDEGHSIFWVMDASIGYRLPKRLGIISLGANNLLDRNFKYQEDPTAIPSFQPARFTYGKLTLLLD
jgi:tetratricopeptide (TPR) repeat protein